MTFKQGQRVVYKGGGIRNAPPDIKEGAKGILLELGHNEGWPVPTYLIRFDGASRPLWIEAAALESL